MKKIIGALKLMLPVLMLIAGALEGRKGDVLIRAIIFCYRFINLDFSYMAEEA